ncbi:MAG TPA: hypothetical protein VFW75_01870 [Acetobacteraceae bacterium]|nr:hypothetical protein [Acetobacteraceae bacterium]
MVCTALIAPAAAGQVLPSSPTLKQPETLKERLSDKASDQQRVDDCRVPLDRRGPRLRPDCPIAAAITPGIGGQPKR